MVSTPNHAGISRKTKEKRQEKQEIAFPDSADFSFLCYSAIFSIRNMNTEAHRELLADSLKRTLTELNLSFESLEQASDGQGGGDVFRLVAEALVEQPQFRQAYKRAHGGREIGRDIDERNVVDSWKKGLREWISGKRNMGDSTIRILNYLVKPAPQTTPAPYQGRFKSSQAK